MLPSAGFDDDDCCSRDDDDEGSLERAPEQALTQKQCSALASALVNTAKRPREGPPLVPAAQRGRRSRIVNTSRRGVLFRVSKSVAPIAVAMTSRTAAADRLQGSTPNGTERLKFQDFRLVHSPPQPSLFD